MERSSAAPLLSTPPPTYDQGLPERPQLWRCLCAVLFVAAALVLALLLVVPVGALLDGALGLTPVGLADFHLTPGTWLVGAASLAALGPASTGAQRLIYGVPGRWLVSVQGRFRWRWAGSAALLVVPTFLVTTVVIVLVTPPGAPQTPAVPTAVWIAISVAVVVVTPLQSAGEEFLFRGLLSRALAAPFARPGAALVASLSGTTVLFWLGHGAFAPFSVVYYLAAGAGLWLTARWTGGLEAGCLMHGCANTFLLLPALLSGQVDTAASTSGAVLLAPAALWLVLPLALRARARRTGLITYGQPSAVRT